MAHGVDPRGRESDDESERKRKGVPGRGAMQLHLDYARPDADKRPIYYIGPFGSRVSFQSQQRRALNVVGSLIEMKRLTADTEVAVIGAGIAGITAFAALSLRGHKVKLYEKGAGILTLQALSQHRYIHPTVNFWPHATPERTTNFPFFDWYSSDCPNVIKAFLRQWEEDPNRPSRDDPKKRDRLKQFTQADPHFGHHLAFKEMDPDTKKVRLIERKGKVDIDVDLVLVAIGFGVEDNLGDPDQRPYWDDDYLVQLSQQSGHDIVISGAGDGGLIDCLRLVYRGFKKGDFALDVIDALSDGMYSSREELQQIEDEARDVKDANARAELLAKRYKALLPRLNRPAKDLLAKALVQKSGDKFPNKVRLVGRFAAPFELGAAPINRLLVAYALQEKAIKFVHANLDREDGKYRLETKGVVKSLPSKVKVVVRHGPANALDGFLTGPEVEKLRYAQQIPGDFASDDSFQNHYFIPEASKYPCQRREPARFADLRLPLAYDFLLERYGALIKLDVDDPSKPAFVIDAVAPMPEPTPEEVEKAPSFIYGISVWRRVRPPGPDKSAVGPA